MKSAQLIYIVTPFLLKYVTWLTFNKQMTRLLFIHNTWEKQLKTTVFFTRNPIVFFMFLIINIHETTLWTKPLFLRLWGTIFVWSTIPICFVPVSSPIIGVSTLASTIISPTKQKYEELFSSGGAYYLMQSSVETA